MKIITVIDSFKGCLTSSEANRAAAAGILLSAPDAIVKQQPMSDGGEGWLEAYAEGTDCEWIEVDTFDPMMRRIRAPYLKTGTTAVIEIARASGLTLLAEEERNPLRATSYGTGRLIVDAVEHGCRHIIVGLGGSATSDAGIGMLRAIIDKWGKGGTWDDVLPLKDVTFTIASDVQNPLCGKNGAAHIFGPQKGATPEMVSLLDERAKRFAEKTALHFGYDCSEHPGAGAAGGLGYAFMQFLHADCRPGIDLLLDSKDFDNMLKDADAVITGEGSFDNQTMMGKGPYGILQRAKKQNVPVYVMAGKVKEDISLKECGYAGIICINPPGTPLAEAMQKPFAMANITRCAEELAKTLLETT